MDAAGRETGSQPQSVEWGVAVAIRAHIEARCKDRPGTARGSLAFAAYSQFRPSGWQTGFTQRSAAQQGHSTAVGYRPHLSGWRRRRDGGRISELDWSRPRAYAFG